MSRSFDVYFAVDWSSRNGPSPNRPTSDAIWVGERLARGADDSAVADERYFRTRLKCRDYLRERLLHHANLRRRVFIGFDFAYGYPAGYASALNRSGDALPWRWIWNELTHLIMDRADNTSNRFEVAGKLNARCGDPTPGPLWGCPTGRDLPTLRATSPGFPYEVRPGLVLHRLRQVDSKQRGVQEVWKLFGAGSVGSQSLVGIPVVCNLRYAKGLSAFSQVWPFETGFTSVPTPEEGPFILHAEIFPGNVPEPLDPEVDIQDQAQVRAVVRWLCNLDDAGRLGTLFAAPRHLTQEALNRCVEEEGWIVGS